jgi:DNA-directed RNA polymerase specialized sigma24 family protein
MNKKLKYDKNEIIQGILNHDRKVLSYVYDTYFGYVIKHVKSNSGNDDDAWDVFQDAIGVVYDLIKLKGADFSLDSSFSTFFYAVCNNIWQKRVRYSIRRWRLQKNVVDGLSESDWDIYNLLRSNIQVRIYLKYYDMLGEDCKKILDLVSEGKNGIEIANELGYSSSQAAYNRKRNCLKKIIELITNDPEYQNLNDYEKP